jgi:hypothetical protein
MGFRRCRVAGPSAPISVTCSSSLIGAFVALHGDEIRELELGRVRRRFEAAGRFGFSAEEKQQRPAALDAKLRQPHVKRENLWREAEGDEAVP